MTATPERCPKCYGTNGHHNTLHERYGNGGGGNKPCPLDPKGTHPMTSNDSPTTPRYSVWSSVQMAIAGPPRHGTIAEAREEIKQLLSEGNRHIHWRIWDHSTTPPTDVTENNPEGPHMTTPHPGKRTPALTIPENVREVTITRSVYPDRPLHVAMNGGNWTMNFNAHDAEVLTRLHEIAAAMEAVK